MSKDMRANSTYDKCVKLIKMLNEIKDIAQKDGDGAGFLPSHIDIKVYVTSDTIREALSLARSLDTYMRINNMSELFTNNLKRGARVLLSNGWEADIMDNMKGDTRLARVYGVYDEVGSVYSHDIIKTQVGSSWYDVKHTPKQIKLKEQLSRMGF
jgi:hypothetical protein